MKGYKLQSSPNFNTEEFERSFNLFYLSIHPHLPNHSIKTKTKSFFGNDNEEVKIKEPYKKDISKVKNIIIYDIEKQSQSFLFDDVKETEVITHFLYEEEFSKKEQDICFNKASHVLKNNRNISEREPLNLLIICQLDRETDDRKIWTTDKYGNNQKLIVTIDSDSEWQIDVYNQKIRIIQRDDKQASIKDYDF